MSDRPDLQRSDQTDIWACIHRGEWTGEIARSNQCPNRGKPCKIYRCELKGQCTKLLRAPGVQWCKLCRDLVPTQ